MEQGEIGGGCYCGAVRYRVERPPRVSTICHCEDCRRAAGAQSVAWVTFPAAGFAWVASAATEHASSAGVIRTFCGRCGTSLTYVSEARADEIDVTTASLDDPEAFPPVKPVFAEQKLSWA